MPRRGARSDDKGVETRGVERSDEEKGDDRGVERSIDRSDPRGGERNEHKAFTRVTTRVMRGVMTTEVMTGVREMKTGVHNLLGIADCSRKSRAICGLKKKSTQDICQFCGKGGHKDEPRVKPNDRGVHKGDDRSVRAVSRVGLPPVRPVRC